MIKPMVDRQRAALQGGSVDTISVPARQQAEAYTVTAAEGPLDENGALSTTQSTAVPTEQGHGRVDGVAPGSQLVPGSEGTQAIAMMAYESALQSIDRGSPDPSKISSSVGLIGDAVNPNASRDWYSRSEGPGLATPSAESIFMRRSRLPQIPQAASKLPLDRKVDSAGTYVDRSHATQGRTLQVNVFAQDDSQSSTDTREVTAPVLSNQLSFPLSSAAQYNVENADASGELSASHSDTIPDWVAQAASFNNPMTTGPSLNNPMTAFVERVDDDSPKVDSGTIERAYGEATSQPTSTTKIADTADGKMLLGDSAPQGITHLNLQDTMSSTPAGSLTSASGPTLGPAQNENAPLNQLPTAYPASAPADQTTSVSRTVVLPGVGTQTVTVTTTRPSPAATQRAARDLVNFAQGVANGAQVVSSTLEQAAKTVSTEMPSVVSFAASTAQSLLSSIQTVESSVRHASSLVASSLRSLPAAAASALAPSSSEDVYAGAPVGGQWDAHAAAPAPSILDPTPAMESSAGGTFDRLAKLAQRATESVAANIGAAQDDSGPVLGTIN